MRQDGDMVSIVPSLIPSMSGHLTAVSGVVATVFIDEENDKDGFSFISETLIKLYHFFFNSPPSMTLIYLFALFYIHTLLFY